MKLKLERVRRYSHERIYVDVSLDDIFSFRKEVASSVVNRKLEDEEIKGLELGRGINGLGYSSMNERHGKFEFFRHLDNGRRGSIAYFEKSGEAHIELDNF